jgi:hypothetical protein
MATTIENAYLSDTDLGADPSWRYTYLHINQIDKTGFVGNNDSVPVHYSYYYYITSGFKFAKTSSNYFFAYDIRVRDSCVACGNGYYKDSLILIKTDLDLNILSRQQRVFADTNSSGGAIYDIKSNGGNVFLTYYDNINYDVCFEALDQNLNTIKKTTVYNINPSWGSTYNALQSIHVTGNKVMVFGDVTENWDSKSNTLLVTFFDLNGNYLSHKQIKTIKPFATFKGVEPCSDGSLLLYYDEAYTAGSTSVGYMGICKMSDNAIVDYNFIFPEEEASGYQACFAYENQDGTLNLFARKNVPNNTGGQQTIVVKVDKTGKLK